MRSATAPALRARAPSSRDRKSTRLNSSHSQISYAVFCLKKKTEYLSTVCGGGYCGGRRRASLSRDPRKTATIFSSDDTHTTHHDDRRVRTHTYDNDTDH